MRCGVWPIIIPNQIFEKKKRRNMKVFIILLLGLAVANADKIVGGTDVGAPIPYQVRIAYSTGSIRCGGSLISSEWVLSAAHCRSPLQYGSWSIVLGYYSSSGDDSVQTFTVIEHKPHENYNANTIDNDVMLLKLNKAANLNENVGIVGLPDQGVDVAIGAGCLVSGWGTTSSGGSISSTLKKATVYVVSNDDCNAKSAYGGDISTGMLCLADDGKDACQGDSGGPAVCSGVLEGVVSWGYGCADPRYPGVYARVSEFRAWIKTNSEV